MAAIGAVARVGCSEGCLHVRSWFSVGGWLMERSLIRCLLSRDWFYGAEESAVCKGRRDSP